MPETKHTPGPWTFGRSNPASRDCWPAIFKHADGKSLGSFFIGGEGDTPEANARLIAAAPDLLSALIQILAHVEDETADRVVNQCTLCYSFRRLAREAIAKATQPQESR